MTDPTLADVSDQVLAELLAVAVADAGPDEVTPPLGEGWTDERRDWFRAYHRACRAGLDGDRRERTWAIVLDGRPAGAVRLALVAEERSVAETGIWLARSARGRGASTAAMVAVLEEARAAGIGEVVADTALVNLPAQAALRRLGFALNDRGDRVEGRLTLA